jgi:hypothetical protein
LADQHRPGHRQDACEAVAKRSQVAGVRGEAASASPRGSAATSHGP